ncbi:cyclin-dependent kinase inhibitor 1-like isoform X2 [Venturia canescens]|uniref:cyclin-dependent kinase inhibitor 1-like isoform X2 n=1 Tax=Venturia canescens TaxID=32260 RepID=UPI001C9CA3A8|nr:cyclin-dependent kinase inhibitor 1-like isoform X2 [Venturia canescens]
MLAARHRARLAMQDGNGDVREAFTRRIPANGNVRRRLFVDADENEGHGQGLSENRTNEFFEDARNNLEQAKERWNFDFVTETPLPGNYVWVKLDKDGKEVPAPDSPGQKDVSESTSDRGACQLTRIQMMAKLDDQ